MYVSSKRLAAFVSAAVVSLSLMQTFAFNAPAIADELDSTQRAQETQSRQQSAAFDNAKDAESGDGSDGAAQGQTSADHAGQQQSETGSIPESSSDSGDSSNSGDATGAKGNDGQAGAQTGANGSSAETARQDSSDDASEAKSPDVQGDEPQQNDNGNTARSKEQGSSSDETPQWLGWREDGNGVTRWYDRGAKDAGDFARNKEIYDSQSDAWYRLDAQGNKIVDHDVYDRVNHKWVRYDAQGRMVKGEDVKYGQRYYFDKNTGAMLKGMQLVNFQEKGTYWVYYDVINGQMAHGERYLNYDAEHTGWYLFDQSTGAVTRGWVYLRSGNKTVYYGNPDGKMRKGEQAIAGSWYYFDPITGATAHGWKTLSGKRVFYDRSNGKMVHGSTTIDGKPYYFDQYTGRKYSRNEVINRMLKYARASYGKNIDAVGALSANGGLICPYGPCMAWVWWVFKQADLSPFLSGGANSGWPHHNFDWYRSRGRVSMTPKVGDLAFYKWSGQDWANKLSASHVAIVVAVKGNRVTIADAAFDAIAERPSYTSALQGYAEPYWG